MNAGAQRARRRREELEALWREAVGEEIAARTRVGQIRSGVLTIEVESAPLFSELDAFRRDELRSFLRDRYTHEPIADLRFKRRRN